MGRPRHFRFHHLLRQVRVLQRGEMNLCEHREVLGVSTPEFRRPGAFADYVVVPQRVLYPLPDAVPFDEAAMVEPLAVAFMQWRLGNSSTAQLRSL